MLDRFLHIWHEYITPPHRLVLAISGGVDSMALLDLVRRTGHPRDQLVVAHYDHGIRAESHEDYHFVENYCKQFGLCFVGESTSVPAYCQQNKISLEEGARHLRYDFLRRVKEQTQADLILTAHHSDDSVETILFNFIRGSFLKGLAGIEMLRQDIFRPLINFSKTELITYAQENHLRYHEDHTNEDVAYSRNRLRHVIIPEILKINPQFKNTLLANAVIYRETQNLLDNLTLFQRLDQLNQETLRQLTPIVLKEIIRRQFHELYPQHYNLSLSQVNEMVKFFLESSSGKKHRFGEKYFIYNDFGFFRFSDQKDTPLPSPQSLPCPPDQKIRFMDYQITVKTIPPTAVQFSSSDTIYLDADSTGKLKVRTWQTGDKFIPFGLNGFKKLQDWFVDKKITRIQRRQLPVFINQEQMIVAVDHTPDNRFKITSSTTSVYAIKITPKS